MGLVEREGTPTPVEGPFPPPSLRGDEVVWDEGLRLLAQSDGLGCVPEIDKPTEVLTAP